MNGQNMRFKGGRRQEKEVAHLKRKVREVGRGQATEGPVLSLRLGFPPVGNGTHCESQFKTKQRQG